MVPRGECIPRCPMSSTVHRYVLHLLQAMCEKKNTPEEKRAAAVRGTAINTLIAACNKHDRFRLLEDDVLAGNLAIDIHPVFNGLETTESMRQMLLLASHFIAHDSLLTFFVPLLYGRPLTTVINGSEKKCLSDPLNDASEAIRKQYLEGVRQALDCLDHSLEFSWADPGKRVYARTLLSDKKPFRTEDCTNLLQTRKSTHIELSYHLAEFYEGDGYIRASRCAQFRHDFICALTLIHELVHTVGVMRRGDLHEPYVRADCPDTEWGYAWEHFMFGTIMNPQDKTTPGIHILMRKAWADHKIAVAAGGKEYCDVPMSYISQWFRQETWDQIARRGPAAVSLPEVHFKIQSSDLEGAWVVSSDNQDIEPDLEDLQQAWIQHPPRGALPPRHQTLHQRQNYERASRQIKFRVVHKVKLQRDNVRVPVRVPKRTVHYPGNPDIPPTPLIASPFVSSELITLSMVPLQVASRKRGSEATDVYEPVTKRVRR